MYAVRGSRSRFDVHEERNNILSRQMKKGCRQMRHVSVHIKKNTTQYTQRREFNIVDALLNHTYCWYIIGGPGGSLYLH